MALAEFLWWLADRADGAAGWLRRRSGDLQYRATGSRLTIWRRELHEMFQRSHPDAEFPNLGGRR